ncbi:MAG TPA: M20/M25/M40 family metallo-hydrolase [Gemmatimonadales bacterium]|nr:M20/M25/M40 family metallo-hydrolase [Gemmatimonadales bacterium]
MTQRRPLFALAVAVAATSAPLQAQDAGLAATYRAAADSLIRAATRDSAAFERLARLVDGFGHRQAGSRSLEAAIDWILSEMKKDGLQNVRGEPVQVTHWVRGAESAVLVKPRLDTLHMLGLGGSVATPKGGITATVLVVSSFEDLARRRAEARGKIVLFDAPFTEYEATRRYRSDGPSAAARAGAVACLIRSVASFSIRSPHTGRTIYDSTVARIPAAALSVEDAMMLRRMQERGEQVVVTLTLGARQLAPVRSRNVVAELVGREKPDEVVVLGGHIDSWDVGQGAMDDAGGSVAAWEAVRLMKVLGLRPRRTVRVVLWTNEENGVEGGRGYRDTHKAELGRHVMAMESDGGVFAPRGFAFAGSDSAATLVGQAASLLGSIGATAVEKVPESPDADIGPLVEEGVPGIGLRVEDSRYFWYHHSEGDTLDKLDPGEVAQCVAAMAVMAYVIADLPSGLPRS